VVPPALSWGGRIDCLKGADMKIFATYAAMFWVAFSFLAACLAALADGDATYFIDIAIGAGICAMLCGLIVVVIELVDPERKD
jgi:hypothetical protein